MRFSLRLLLTLVLVAAAFCGGWVAKTNYDRWQHHSLPVLQGIVLRTRVDMAAISIGSDNGVRNGMTVQFFRNGQPICQGKILRVQSSMSAVKVAVAGKNNPLFEGDTVKIKY